MLGKVRRGRLLIARDIVRKIILPTMFLIYCATMQLTLPYGRQTRSVRHSFGELGSKSELWDYLLQNMLIEDGTRFSRYLEDSLLSPSFARRASFTLSLCDLSRSQSAMRMGAHVNPTGFCAAAHNAAYMRDWLGAYTCLVYMHVMLWA